MAEQSYRSSIDAFKKVNNLGGGEDYSSSINAFKSINGFGSNPIAAPRVVPEAVVPRAAPKVIDNSLPPQLAPLREVPQQAQQIVPQGNQVITPPGLKSALPWTTPKPTLPERPEIPPQGTPFRGRDIIPSLKSGTKSTLGRIKNLIALKEKATRENPRLMMNRSGLTDPYSNIMMSMMPDPVISPGMEEQSKKIEEELLQEGAKYLTESAEYGRPLTWEEWEGFGGFLDYATGVAGQAGPSMLVGMVTGGLASPLLLEAEVNDELRSIPGLSSEEQLRLVEAGGLIAGSLEILGLSVIAKGIPKGLLAKLGTKKIAAAVEKLAGKSKATQFVAQLGKVGGRAATGAVGEGIAEWLQDEVIMLAGKEAGKKYSPEEVASRRLNSIMAGITMGAGARPAMGALSDVSGAIQDRSSNNKLMEAINLLAEQEARRVQRPDQRIPIPEPIQKPPIVSEFIPEIAAPILEEGGDLSPLEEPKFLREINEQDPPPLEEVAPESPAEVVSTPQQAAVSPGEVQESTEATEVVNVEEKEKEFDEAPTRVEREKLFNELAEQQRGNPEAQMRKVQSLTGGGILSMAVEHGGDLVNRMSKVFHEGGYEYAVDKIGKLANIVPQKYGFEKEALENLKWYADDRLKIPLDEALGNLKRELKQFAEEHKKLPAYNEAHRMFRDFNVAIGEWRFNDAKRIILQLESKVNEGSKAWDKWALEGLDPETKPEVTKDVPPDVPLIVQDGTETDTNVAAEGGVEPEVETPVVVEEKPVVVEEKPSPKVEEPKAEIPQVKVEEEVANKQQPIKAKPEAKEGEPGFKRKALPGTNNEVITPDSSMKVNTTYKIVELSELLQAEGEFQNRDRSKEQSTDLVRERATKFDPAQVIDPARTSDSGPPIVLQSGVIISGNGRVLTIKELYENPEYQKQKEDYQMALFTKYKKPGLENPFVGESGVIKQPVLVQVLNTAKLAKDDPARVKRIIKFVKASNIQKADTLSAGERAQNDTVGLKKVISLFRGGEITSIANSGFVQAFANENVSASERGEFFTEGTELSNSGLKRIQGALLTAAYGNNESVVKILESTDNDVKAITNSMLDVAPKYTELKAGMDKDTIPKDMDLTPYIVKALDKISSLRQQGIKPAGDFAQTDFLSEREDIRDMIVKAFYKDDLKNARSQKFITNILNKTIDKILAQDYTKGLPGLEEASKTSSATEILDVAIKETKQEDERAKNGTKDQGELGLTEAAPGGIDQGSGRGRDTKQKPKSKPRKVEAAKKTSLSKIITWYNPEFNQSAKEQIFFDMAAADENMAESLSIKERIGIIKNMEPLELDKRLRKMVQNKFGLKYVLRDAAPGMKRNPSDVIDSINNMINAYHNLQGMAAVLGIPLKAIGLDGTLGLRSEGHTGSVQANAFYQSSPNNNPEGPPYITIKGRFNAFAHEWGHALDYHLLNKLGQDWSRGMSNRLRGKSILDEETKERIEPWQATESADQIKYAFGDLLNAMFQEEGETAAKILELESKISKARSDKVIKELNRQLEDLLQGMSKKRIPKSDYLAGAENQASMSTYYKRPTEMLARAFESYVSHRITVQSEGKSSPSNAFVAMPEMAYALKADNAIDDLAVQDFVKRYPKEAERLLIFEKFSALFEALELDVLEGIAANPDKSPMVEWSAEFEQKQNNNPFSKEARLEHERELKVNQRAFEKTQQQPTKFPNKSRKEQWWIALEDGLIHPWLGTKYGTLLSMMRRYKDKKKAHGAMVEIFKAIGIEPGGELSTSNTYPEAVRREVRRLSYAFKTMTDRHDGFLFNAQEENDLRLLLTSDPRTITKAMKGEMSPKVLKLAGDLRNLLHKIYHDVKKSGVNIDYLESNAYLPRILDVQKVFSDQKTFTKNAYDLYSDIIWIDQEQEFDGYDQDQIMSVGSIANEKKFRVSNGIDLVTHPDLEDYVRIYKNIKDKRKAIEKMELEDAEPDDIEKAQIALEKYIEKHQEILTDGYDTTRDFWSNHLASDWNLRIHQMAGEDPSASSPMANFTKKRVLPKQADSYMIDFYTDPIDAIGKYITGAVRKAEYSKRFGRHLIPPGKKRFAVTKQLQDYLDYLFREKMAGEVNPIDVQNMRTDIDAILGRTAPSDMGLKKTLNTAHSYALMGMLTRAVLTSIPEPFVAGIKMRSSLKGLETFGLTLQEALTYVSKDVEQTVQKRRQVANILGLLDDPSVGEMASNRAGGTMADDPKNQGRMNLWFVRVGLQGLTNAQRRATMTVSFGYLKEMGLQFLNPVGSSEQAIKDNKKEAELVLLDLGIPPGQMDDFSKYMIDIELVKGLPDADMLMDEFGDLTSMSELLAISAGRIVERSIQDPLIGNRPRYAENPLGKFVYSIQSFNYSFQQNVITGEGKHIKRLFKEIGGKRAAFRTAQLIGPVAQLYIAHALVSAFREYLMNGDRWEEKKKDGKLGSHIAGLAVSRAGTFGAFDPMINAYTGLRYQRDLSNFMIGAIGSWYTKPTEDIIKLFSGDTNSANTTATEERALMAAYQLIIVPAMVYAISNPNFLSVLGPLAGPTAGALAMLGTSHTVKKAVSSKFIQLLYGSKGDMSRRKNLMRKARKTR